MISIDSNLNDETDFYKKTINKPIIINDDITDSAEHHRFQVLATSIPDGFSNQSSQLLENTTALNRASEICDNQNMYFKKSMFCNQDFF